MGSRWRIAHCCRALRGRGGRVGGGRAGSFFAGAMVVRLRLARFGRYKFPFYRIYAADHRAPRDGKHLEILGHYDPIPQVDGAKHVGLKFERIKYWLGVGAQPSKPVADLLATAGIIPQKPKREHVKKGISKKTAKEEK